MPIQLVSRPRTAPDSRVDALGVRLAIEFTGTLLLAALVPTIEVAVTAGRCSDCLAGPQISVTVFSAAAGCAVLAFWALAHGAHLNPILTLAAWLGDRRFPYGGTAVVAFMAAQTAGAFLGVAAVDLLAGQYWSPSAEVSPSIWRVGAEFATATGLVALFLLFSIHGRGLSVAASLGGYLDFVAVAGLSAWLANPAIVLATLPQGSFDDTSTDFIFAVFVAQVGGAIIGTQFFSAGTQGGATHRIRRRI